MAELRNRRLRLIHPLQKLSNYITPHIFKSSREEKLMAQIDYFSIERTVCYFVRYTQNFQSLYARVQHG